MEIRSLLPPWIRLGQKHDRAEAEHPEVEPSATTAAVAE